MLRLIFVFSLWNALAVFCLADQTHDWPGWRGDGSGVSLADSLPESWDAEQGVDWKTKIDGEGFSSPIIWQDKVFVTTALWGSESAVFRATIATALIALLVLAFLCSIVGILANWRATRTGNQTDTVRPAMWLRFVRFLEWIAVGALACILLLHCARLIRELLSDGPPPTFHRYSLNNGLFRASYAQGDVFRAWQAAATLFLPGALAAIGYLRGGSRWRLVGAIFLVTFAVVYLVFAPRDMWTQFDFQPLLKNSVAALAAAVWFALTFFIWRRYATSQSTSTRWSMVGVGFPICMLAVAALNFLYLNYLQPRSGLWRTVVCLNRADGTTLWQNRAFVAPASRKYIENSYATPTPATDGEVLVAYFGQRIVCMDLKGRTKWIKMEPKYLTYLRYGAGSGPVIAGDRIIYAFMAENPEAGRPDAGEDRFAHKRHSYITAVDKDSGEELWKICPPGAYDSYGTPLLVNDGGRLAVLFSTNDHAMAYDVETGEQLWVVNIPIFQPVPSLVADESTAYLTGGTHGPAVAAAIDLGGRGDVSETHVKWSITKGINTCSSPVLYEDLLYWVTEGGVIHCVDATSGEILYRKRLGGGEYLASLVAGDGKIYVPNKDGEIHVVKAGRDFQRLATNSIGEPSFSSPALVENRIFLRGKEHLFCIFTETARSEDGPSDAERVSTSD